MCNCQNNKLVTNLIDSELINFETKAYQKNKGVFDFNINNIKNNDGKWTILFFYPANFTSLCNSEVLDLNAILADIEKDNIQAFVASCDSVHSHFAFANSSEQNKQINLTFIDDKNSKIARSLGIYNFDNGLSYRGTFIISPEGIIKAYEIHDFKIGRDVKEDFRKAKAARYVANNNNSACSIKEVGRQ